MNLPSQTDHKIEQNRVQFKQLIAANPNHFGNLIDSPYQAIEKIIGNTTYEEVTCVGFNQKLNTLEATIEIKLPFGYGGNLCSTGSTEYVRFFLDYGEGAGWEDAGVVAVNVHDIPSGYDCAQSPDKPLNYVLTQEIKPRKKFCGTPVLPLVRAILSWNAIPSLDPNQPPVWGNVLDEYIQIPPRPWFIIDLVNVLGNNIGQKLTIPPELEGVELEPIPMPDPPPVELLTQVKMYGVQEIDTVDKRGDRIFVEPHRFGFNDIQSAIAPNALSHETVSAKIVEWKSVGLDWSAAVNALQETSGNTTYEELHCLGLDYNREWLVATLQIKQSGGYSGSLCQKGSQEYIAFWADWDNTCEWTYLGTRAINVHDIPKMPGDGLHYAAMLKVNLDQHRRTCKEPKVARVRAVLSWSLPPSTTDPDDVPFWGNRVDSHVQIKPGKPSSLKPQVTIIGGISTAQTDIFGNGMTKSGAVFALYGSPADPNDPSRFCPFGGRIHVQAYAPPELSALGYKYRILVRKFGTLTEIPVTTPFQIADGVNAPIIRTPNPVTGYISYVNPAQNIFDMLGWWDTSGDDLWEIRLEMVDAANNFLGSTIWYRIQLDNTRPEAEIHIDNGGDCQDFSIGIPVNGHFVARDKNFGVFTLDTLPNSLTPPNPIPTSGIFQTAPNPIGNPWTLDTSSMKRCGYVVVLRVWDRAIVNSIPGSHNYNEDDVGFCLREKS
ncbi:hypothetical protein [Limnofasciculus baicalensis]|uniref:Uncharacterized protein n=1 Tax=Limnofasciculus baicalensis BBK-W-15 TaxID=2699891 RepID=A0AAE3GR09_9CYAN|nr:hypothetical protein [Limnofasciculus baicalensis]MCP2728944.1 hypothetical protein [Limnofasciculus baicalensis BBK-W-15]